MAIAKLQKTLQYYLIALNQKGEEQEQKKTSNQIVKVLSTEPITDVFIFIHGWMGDVPAAHKQYSRWVGAMAKNTADIEQMQSSRDGFRPLMIGLHWPSMLWGDETLEDVSFDVNELSPVEQLVEKHAQLIADTEAAREALRTIFTAAMEDSAPDRLPPEVSEAYSVLVRESGLETEGVGAAPGADLESFDPEEIYEAADDEPVDFAGTSSFWSKLLQPLQLLTFWSMKDLARRIGETTGFELLTKFQKAASNNVRFHLMGHSFGCIVVSGILAGPDCRGTLVRPVNSVSLIQGALSLWSYCNKIPVASGSSGYFHRILADRKVNGPIITTQSEYDFAVGRMYPIAAGMKNQVSYGPEQAPKYGAVGTFGLCGLSSDTAVFMKMLPVNGTYKFEPGKVYNLESTQYICDTKDGPFIGAHNDIARPEVAHALWQAAIGI